MTAAEAMQQNAGQPQPQYNAEQVAALVEVQQRQMDQQIKGHKVQVCLAAMAQLTERAKTSTVGQQALNESDDQLWDRCVKIISEFLAPAPPASGRPRLAE